MKKIFTPILIITILYSCGNLGNNLNENIPDDNPTKKENEIPANTIEYLNHPTKNNSTIWDTIYNKVEWFIRDKEAQRDLNQVPLNFQKFYTQYISDSTYQKNHIDFEQLIGVISECEQTFRLDNKNWEFSNWNFTQEFNKDNNIDGWDNVFYFDENTFFFQFEIKEVGIICQEGFEKINGKWKLVLYVLNNC